MAMHPSPLLLILVAASIAGVRAGHPAADGSPAARFWEKALPGTPMPDAISDLIEKGIDHSPLKERYYAAYNSLSVGHSLYRKDFNVLHATLPAGYFFNDALLRAGSIMTVSLPPATTTPILPLAIAEKLPFGDLDFALSMFNITKGSPEADVVGETLHVCHEHPHHGEQMACATSLEATVRAAMRMLGTTQGVWAAASAVPRAGLPRQRYVLRQVTQLGGDRHVGCHDEAFPYAVFECHITDEQPTRAYVISLQGLQYAGSEVAMVAICHLDTSDWNPTHPAFKMLHSQPGGAPVCHFFPYANMVFGTNNAELSEI